MRYLNSSGFVRLRKNLRSTIYDPTLLPQPGLRVRIFPSRNEVAHSESEGEKGGRSRAYLHYVPGYLHFFRNLVMSSIVFAEDNEQFNHLYFLRPVCLRYKGLKSILI